MTRRNMTPNPNSNLAIRTRTRHQTRQLGLERGLNLKLGNSILGPRTQTETWLFELCLDIELGNSDSNSDWTSNLGTQSLDLELKPKLGNSNSHSTLNSNPNLAIRIQTRPQTRRQTWQPNFWTSTSNSNLAIRTRPRTRQLGLGLGLGLNLKLGNQ